jgi:ubiquinone/menaquinone biosynthesis C-methylase UbiE
MLLTRVLEPEVMDSEEEARDYDEMGHDAVNARFCEDLLVLSPDVSRTLDVGTGTARIPIELCRRTDQARVTAIDLAASMVRLGARNVELAGLSGAISVELIDAKGLPYADASFRCVVSNSIVHHIPEPRAVLAEMLRVLAPGGLLFVRDLFRPDRDETVRELVARYAGNETPRQQALLDASLRAAFTLSEMREHAAAVGLPPDAVQLTSDRHWTLARRQATGAQHD